MREFLEYTIDYLSDFSFQGLLFVAIALVGTILLALV